MSQTSPYKPSPLSIGSPRTSPFRRPTTPTSPSNALRPSTPTRATSPSKLQTLSTPAVTSSPESWTPRGLTPTPIPREAPPSPTPTASTTTTTIPALARQRTPKSFPSHPATLPPNHPLLPQLHSAFGHLDRSSTGSITRTDIAETLSSLSLPSNPSDISSFFPAGSPQSLPLATFLSTLSGLLAPLSSQEELLNAFAAFDEKDSGEVDVGELRDAVVNTRGEGGPMSVGDVERVLNGYVGKRAFGKGFMGAQQGKGEVFKYREWVGGILGPEKAE